MLLKDKFPYIRGRVLLLAKSLIEPQSYTISTFHNLESYTGINICRTLKVNRRTQFLDTLILSTKKKAELTGSTSSGRMCELNVYFLIIQFFYPWTSLYIFFWHGFPVLPRNDDCQCYKYKLNHKLNHKNRTLDGYHLVKLKLNLSQFNFNKITDHIILPGDLRLI